MRSLLGVLCSLLGGGGALHPKTGHVGATVNQFDAAEFPLRGWYEDEPVDEPSADQVRDLSAQRATYAELLAASPGGPRGPEWRRAIIMTSVELREPDATVVALDAFADSVKASPARSGASARAAETLEETLRRVGTAWHNVGIQVLSSAVGFDPPAEGSDAAAAFHVAEHAYRLYLQRFPDHHYANTVRYCLAQLLAARQQYEEAYALDRFLATAPGERQHCCDDHAMGAAHAALEIAVAMVDWSHGDSSARGRPGCLGVASWVGDDLGPDPGGANPQGPAWDALTRVAADTASALPPVARTPLSPWEQREVDGFVEATPPGDQVRGYFYRLGLIHYQHGEDADAQAILGVVVRMDPESDIGERAAILSLAAAIREGDWVGARDSAATYLAMPRLGNDEFRDRLSKLLSTLTLRAGG